MYRVEALACCYSRVAKMYVLQDSFIFLYFSSFLERERERGGERERERERERKREGLKGRHYPFYQLLLYRYMHYLILVTPA